MTDIFTQEIETLKKEIEHQLRLKKLIEITKDKLIRKCANAELQVRIEEFGHWQFIQAKLETAQKLKLAHDNEIAKLKFEKLKFLEDFIIVNDNEKLFIPNKFLIDNEISKLKSELK